MELRPDWAARVPEPGKHPDGENGVEDEVRLMAETSSKMVSFARQTLEPSHSHSSQPVRLSVRSTASDALADASELHVHVLALCPVPTSPCWHPIPFPASR